MLKYVRTSNFFILFQDVASAVNTPHSQKLTIDTFS